MTLADRIDKALAEEPMSGADAKLTETPEQCAEIAAARKAADKAERNAR